MVPGVPWFVPHHSTSASIFTWPPLQSQISLCLPLTRTLVIGFRVHPDNPGRSHLETRNLMTSAKTLFPDKVPFTVLGGCIFQGPLLDPLQSHLVDDSPTQHLWEPPPPSMVLTVSRQLLLRMLALPFPGPSPSSMGPCSSPALFTPCLRLPPTAPSQGV